MKIFIVEDDVTLRNELSFFLESYGYECETSDNFKNMLSIILEAKCNLILLDINLPYLNGYNLCREIRKVSNVPIIVVTSRASDMDELMSMNLGADDFITKPYNTQILLARIGAIFKRMEIKESSQKQVYNGVKLLTSKSMAIYNENKIELTKNEMKILSVLFYNAGKIVSREQLMDEMWQSDEFVDDNTLTVNVNRLRKKLNEIGAKNFIRTKRGQGYII